MTDLSIIIPARNEEFLQVTIDDILKNIRGDTEIFAMLDGYWPDKGIPQNPRVHVVHHAESIGQRACVNEGARLSEAKYIMKCDAHCAFDEGFDVKLMYDCEYDWTVIPRMYNLHAFDWKCQKCGYQVMQGPYPKKCEKCDNIKDFKKVIIWQPKRNKRSDFARFDSDMKFQYWRDFEKRPESKGDIVDMMASVGACFFMHRQRFFDLGGMDEGHGSWGQFGVEVACKAWLSGGRHVVNKKTWFSHLFRTQQGFGFPYDISGRQVAHARQYSQNLWKNNKWPKAKRDLQWLLDKFAPVPDWDVSTKKNIVEKPAVGMVYYTDNQCEERILWTVRNQLNKCRNGHSLVSVSHLPIDFGENHTVDYQRSVLAMFRQILLGLEKSTADVVFLVEHDILYHPSHFDFIPPKEDVFYYNRNVWNVDAQTGQALFIMPKQVSGLCAYRLPLLEHYRKRVERVEKEGFTRKMGFEPGTHQYPRGFDYTTSQDYMSKFPNVDIRHKHNLTANRFKKEQYRRVPKIWEESDEIPFWGKTKGRFDEFLKEVANAKF